MAFRFFDLPREIRDICYKQMLDKDTMHVLAPRGKRPWIGHNRVPSYSPYGLWIQDKPVPSLQIIAKQFKDEYLAVAFETATLHVHVQYIQNINAQVLKPMHDEFVCPKTFFTSLQRVVFSSRVEVGERVFDESLYQIQALPKQIDHFLAQMPSVNSCNLDMSLAVESLAFDCTRSSELPMTFLDIEKPATPTALRRFDHRISVHCSQFVFTTNELRSWQDVRALQEGKDNRIVFSTSLSEDPDALCGLDLEMLEAGPGYDFIKKKINAKWISEGGMW